jgi:UDP-N-acetylmuramate dehydrogenase
VSTAASFDPVAVATEIQRRIGVRVVRDEPMGRHSTMRVGGPADLFATVRNAFELRAILRFARSREIPHLVLGRGSNLVVSDRGIRGLVVHVRAEGSAIEGDRYRAEAGVPMARAATETQRAGLAGLEFGLAIPGTIGGAVWANAGAHGSDVAAVLETADLVLADGSEARLTTADLRLAYRDSRLKHADPGLPWPPEVVLAATFRLTPEPDAVIRRRLDEIRAWRRAHQPLGLASAGSVFRNPPQGPPAGLLVDRAGLKGLRIGGASVSTLHANFIVNDAGCSAADVRRLAEAVRATILERDGIALEYEILFTGDWTGWPWADGPASTTTEALR